MDAINTAMASQFMSWGREPAIAARRQLCAQKSGVDGIVGFIDGTHLHIRVCTRIEHVEAVNRKGWHSTVMQAVVDHKGRFLDVTTGFFGNCADRYVFEASGFGRAL